MLHESKGWVRPAATPCVHACLALCTVCPSMPCVHACLALCMPTHPCYYVFTLMHTCTVPVGHWDPSGYGGGRYGGNGASTDHCSRLLLAAHNCAPGSGPHLDVVWLSPAESPHWTCLKDQEGPGESRKGKLVVHWGQHFTTKLLLFCSWWSTPLKISGQWLH